MAIIGYARSKLNVRDLRATIAEHLKGATEDVSRFLDLVTYLPGTYDSPPGLSGEGSPLCESQSGSGLRTATDCPAAAVPEHACSCSACRRCRRCW